MQQPRREHYREVETRRMIENYVRWGGDGEHVRCALSTLDVLRFELRAEAYGAGPRIPVLALDASRAAKALERVDPEDAGVLVLHYTSRGPVFRKARRLGMSTRTFYRVLDAAHFRFWSALEEVALESRTREVAGTRERQYAADARAAVGRSLDPPSKGLSRMPRRQRRPKTTPADDGSR